MLAFWFCWAMSLFAPVALHPSLGTQTADSGFLVLGRELLEILWESVFDSEQRGWSWEVAIHAEISSPWRTPSQ